MASFSVPSQKEVISLQKQPNYAASGEKRCEIKGDGQKNL